MAWTQVGATLAAGTVSSVTTTTPAIGVTLAAGTLCVMTVGFTVATTTLASVSDSGSNTWTLLEAGTPSSGNLRLNTYYSVLTTGGNLTFSATGTVAGAYPTLSVQAFTYTAGTVSVLTMATNNQATGGTTITGPALTPSSVTGPYLTHVGWTAGNATSTNVIIAWGESITNGEQTPIVTGAIGEADAYRLSNEGSTITPTATLTGQCGGPDNQWGIILF